MMSDILKEEGIQPRELNPDMGESGEFEISIAKVSYEFDFTNDNYVVTLFFNKGGSYEYILGGDELYDLANRGTEYYLNYMREIPMPWPFGSKDYLHWPNQRK